MPDEGAVERNVAIHAEALRRAAHRGVHCPQPEVSAVDDGLGNAVSSGAEAGEAIAAGNLGEAVSSALGTFDATVSWGRGGATEETVGRGEEPVAPVEETFAGVYPEPVGGPTMPNTFGRPVLPVADHSQWGGPGGAACNSMADILRRG